MNETTATDVEVTLCDCCRTIPLAHLALDIDEPTVGWEASLRAGDIVVVHDGLGRPAIFRSDVRTLLRERRQQKLDRAEQSAKRAAAHKPPAGAGVPALDGASPFESLAAAGLVTPEQEFGHGDRLTPAQEFLDAQLAEGRRHERDKRAAAEALKNTLEGEAKGRDR